jgi:hypothetical protein
MAVSDDVENNHGEELQWLATRMLYRAAQIIREMGSGQHGFRVIMMVHDFMQFL